MKQIEKFSKIFLVNNPDSVSETQMDTLLMVSENWDYYFSSLVDNLDCVDSEEIRNVLFVEFEDRKKHNAFVERIDQTKLIGTSFQHKNPCLLMFEL